MQTLAGSTQGALEVAQRHGPSMHVLNVKGKLTEEVVAENANHLVGSAAIWDNTQHSALDNAHLLDAECSRSETQFTQKYAVVTTA